jgi:hypothetical protein
MNNWGAIAAAAFALTAATSPGAVAATLYDSAAQQYVVHIVVSGPANPSHALSPDDEHDKATKDAVKGYIMFGVLGAGDAMMSDDESYEEQRNLDRVLEPQSVQLGDEMRSAVAALLEKSGYDVQEEPRYNTDAVLNLEFGKVSFSGSGGPGIAPIVVLHARCISMNSHEVLFDRLLTFARQSPSADHAAADPQYVFANFGETEMNTEKAAAGLQSSIPALAALLVQDMHSP